MRDSSFDSQSFLIELEKIAEKSKQYFLLSTSVLDNPNRKARWENTFSFQRRDLNFFIMLSIVSWYIPEEYGILLRMSIAEETKESEEPIIGTLLKSKAHCLCFLCDTHLWHTRDFFGNIFNQRIFRYIVKGVRPTLTSRKPPRQLVYRRGYKDKGSRRKDINPNLYIDTSSLVRDEELRTKSHQDTLAFLQAFLE